MGRTASGLRPLAEAQEDVDAVNSKSERPSLHLFGLVFSDLHYANEVPARQQRWANTVWVMAMAPVGAACRFAAGFTGPGLGVNDLTANCIGCFLMGILVGTGTWLPQNRPALYTGLTTGFCGSFTTFSGWTVNIARHFLARKFMLAILAALCGLVLPVTSLVIGIFCGRRAFYRPEAQLDLPLYHTYKLQVALLASLVQCMLFLGLAFLYKAQRGFLLGLILVAPGAWLRYRVSAYNRNHTLPYYTALVNLIASFSSALCFQLARSRPKNSLIFAVSFGFDGGLSTVSTFCNELRVLFLRGHTFHFFVEDLRAILLRRRGDEEAEDDDDGSSSSLLDTTAALRYGLLTLGLGQLATLPLFLIWNRAE